MQARIIRIKKIKPFSCHFFAKEEHQTQTEANKSQKEEKVN